MPVRAAPGFSELASAHAAFKILNLERKMDEQEEAEEAENQWQPNMDGLTRKS